jgi:hypothetical protein
MAVVRWCDESLAVFEAITGTVDGQYVAVVQEPVEDGGRKDVVAQHGSPLGEVLVAGDDGGALSYRRLVGWENCWLRRDRA